MLVYAITGLVYVLVLSPILFFALRRLKKIAPLDESAEVYEGIAFGCLIAICGGVFLTSGFGVRGSILAWLLLCSLIGVAVWVPQRTSITELASIAVLPAIALLGSLLAVYFLPLLLTGIVGTIVSVEEGADAAEIGTALGLSLFVAIVTIPAVAAAVLARQKIVSTAKAALGLQPGSFENLEKVVNTCIRIAGAVLAVFALTLA